MKRIKGGFDCTVAATGEQLACDDWFHGKLR